MNSASFALVALGGAVGAVSRWLVSTLVARLVGPDFGWGTAIVNLTGCFLIGIALGRVERGALPDAMRLLLVTGFLGGLTTFSAFSGELVGLLRAQRVLPAACYLALNAGAGPLLTVVGLRLSMAR